MAAGRCRKKDGTVDAEGVPDGIKRGEPPGSRADVWVGEALQGKPFEGMILVNLIPVNPEVFTNGDTDLIVPQGFKKVGWIDGEPGKPVHPVPFRPQFARGDTCIQLIKQDIIQSLFGRPPVKEISVDGVCNEIPTRSRGRGGS